MDRVINGKLLAHPVNWLIVWTVLAVAGFAFVTIHHGMTGDCGCSSAANPD